MHPDLLPGFVDHVDVANGSPEFGKRDVRRAVGNVDPLVAGGLEIVEAVATGAKHAKPDARPSRPVKYAPGDERVVPTFAWDTPGAGWNEGRWGGPGVYVQSDARCWFLDDAVRFTVQGFALAFPDLFGGVDLGPAAFGFDELAAAHRQRGGAA